MADLYQNFIYGGVNAGSTLVQASGSIGGSRHVFVKLQGGAKQGLVFPTNGGILSNPFPGRAKAFAGDLVEYDPGITTGAGSTCKLLKTYEVVSVEDSIVNIARDGYKHVPFVGDIIMAAPDTIDGTGTPSTVTGVSETTATNGDGATVDVWAVTVDTAITASEGDILIEADADGNPVVTNPNCFLACDYDFKYAPASGDEDYDGARYLINPCLANEDTKLIISKMTPLPATYLALNESKVSGWFQL